MYYNSGMSGQKVVINYYEAQSGRFPFRDWFDSLKDKKTQARVQIAVDRLEDGNPGKCESVGAGVYELKLDFGPGYRVYFGQAESRIVILLFGGDKSTQPRDIKRAQEYWCDYRSRYV